MSELDAFRTQVETFISLKEWTPTRFGKAAAGDPLFVFELRNGREPRIATRTRVLSFISASLNDNPKKASRSEKVSA